MEGKKGLSKGGGMDWGSVYARLDVFARSLEPRTQDGKVKKVLASRARTLASGRTQPAPEGHIEVVEFVLAHENYAFETAYIKEVYPLMDITPVPGTPSFVAGIINARGNILSVIDMKKFFGLPEKGLTNLNKVIVLSSASMEFGVLADSITGVTSIDPAGLDADLPTLTDMRQDFLKGVTRGRVVVLDAIKLLNDGRMIVHEE